MNLTKITTLHFHHILIFLGTKLENALFLSFINILNINSIKIRECANCGKYFFPISKSNEKFCTNRISRTSKKTCRAVGAFKVYTQQQN